MATASDGYEVEKGGLDESCTTFSYSFLTVPRLMATEAYGSEKGKAGTNSGKKRGSKGTAGAGIACCRSPSRGRKLKLSLRSPKLFLGPVSILSRISSGLLPPSHACSG